MCDITSDNIDEGLLRCFDTSSNYVTYRARLSGFFETGRDKFISYIEDWVSGGPIVRVQGVLLEVDAGCPVSITSFNDRECVSSSNSQSSTDDASDTTAIIGGVVIAIVLIIAVTVIITAIVIIAGIRRGHHGELKVAEG